MTSPRRLPGHRPASAANPSVATESGALCGGHGRRLWRLRCRRGAPMSGQGAGNGLRGRALRSGCSRVGRRPCQQVIRCDARAIADERREQHFRQRGFVGWASTAVARRFPCAGGRLAQVVVLLARSERRLGRATERQAPRPARRRPSATTTRSLRWPGVGDDGDSVGLGPIGRVSADGVGRAGHGR